jgi:hypothetical protein
MEDERIPTNSIKLFDASFVLPLPLLSRTGSAFAHRRA